MASWRLAGSQVQIRQESRCPVETDSQPPLLTSIERMTTAGARVCEHPPLHFCRLLTESPMEHLALPGAGPNTVWPLMSRATALEKGSRSGETLSGKGGASGRSESLLSPLTGADSCSLIEGTGAWESCFCCQGSRERESRSMVQMGGRRFSYEAEVRDLGEEVSDSPSAPSPAWISTQRPVRA